ncbi:hypothetical protein DB347_20950 [Opitutaceae bacterium EW11]|nr:hypothetical protein DB347_20950 [Opitutaceae bacterium EW11]
MNVTDTLTSPTLPHHFFPEAPAPRQKRLLPCNVGGIDRAARAGVAALALGVALSSPRGRMRTIAWIVAASATFTALTRYCPANQLLHINTCRG